MPDRVVFDSNIHDRILASEADAALIRQAIAADRLHLLRHECQRRELRRVPDAARRAALLALYDALDGETASAEIDLMLAADDALLLLARAHDARLVSDDKALCRRLRESGGKAMDYAAFRAWLAD